MAPPLMVLLGVRQSVLRCSVFFCVTVLLLTACAEGRPSQGFIIPSLADAYIPLSKSELFIFERSGAAMAIAPNIAVTNAHNALLVPEDAVLGQSQDYDLLFFRTSNSSVAQMSVPRVGQSVIAYGQGTGGELREARGTITSLNEPVASRCDHCAVQFAIAFEADAGPGFSGGPVVDAGTGAVLGIVFGYRDDSRVSASRLMFAYDIALVAAELNHLLSRNGL